MDRFAVKAFRFAALDYLLKPVDPELLSQSIKKAEDIIDREKITLKIESFLYNMEHLNKESKKIILKTFRSKTVVQKCKKKIIKKLFFFSQITNFINSRAISFTIL